MDVVLGAVTIAGIIGVTYVIGWVALLVFAWRLYARSGDPTVLRHVSALARSYGASGIVEVARAIASILSRRPPDPPATA